jgi:large subunit ribosomal protein L25
MASENARLTVTEREPGGSRTARRVRRTDRVPGIVYGGDAGPVPFDVDARELRHALTHGGAVIDLAVGDGGPTPVLVKDTQRHPVTGTLVHIDLLRVRLDRPIQASVALELDGVEDAPGVKEGGVLEHVARELTIEALPGDIPDALRVDVSAMVINDTMTLAAVTPPAGVTLLDDVEETVVATLSPPRVEEEPEELEEETELVGEPGEEAPAEGEEAERAAPAGEGGGGGESEGGGGE